MYLIELKKNKNKWLNNLLHSHVVLNVLGEIIKYIQQFLP